MNFDYVIVGGGTSGLTIAKILSSKYNIIVLEAGRYITNDPDVNDSNKVLSLDYTNYCWQGTSIPQVNVNNRTFEWTGGRLLGGSSAINGEQYVRGSVHLYDDWAKIAGSTWSPEQVFSRFNTLEAAIDKNTSLGKSGFLSIRKSPVKPTQFNKDIAFRMGDVIDNYNNPRTPIGSFYSWDMTQQNDGSRETSFDAFGDNYTIVTEATVLKVIFDGITAIGVSYLHNGEVKNVYCNKVILSAGLKSAKILMLSGIGPDGNLVNNPEVGRNIKNHPAVTATFDLGSEEKINTESNVPFINGAFVPDLSIDPDRRGFELINMQSKPGMLTQMVLLLQQKSNGFMKLRSNDPLELEYVDFNYFSDKRDLESFKSYFRTYALDFGYKLVTPDYNTVMDDKLLEEYIKNTMIQGIHYNGSCSMRNVVDELGNVYGVNNLIVADLSIMPVSNDGNTQAPAYLIGWTIGMSLLE